jgi:hypothetical protein
MCFRLSTAIEVAAASRNMCGETLRPKAFLVFLMIRQASACCLSWVPTSETQTASQTENDSDRAVDADEGLNLKGIAAGRYDVRFKDKTGRSCVVRDVAVNGGQPYAFSISETDLKDCKR